MGHLEPRKTGIGAQLRHGPWLVLSAAIHGAVLLLVCALIAPQGKSADTQQLEVVDLRREEVVAPRRQRPPEVEQEDVASEVVIREPSAFAEPALAAADTGSDTAPRSRFDRKAGFDGKAGLDADQFDASEWSSTVALAGNAGHAGGRYGSRGAGRGAGGKSHSDAIDAGLLWLSNHQDEDGKWDCDQFMKHDDPSSEPCDGAGNGVHDIGVTGLALLAFLGDGSTMRSGPHRDTIRKGVCWLRGQQQENGLFGTNTSHDFVYDHAIAAYAMCEAYGLSGYQTLRDTAQRGIDYLESHRNPYSVWRYMPHDAANDTSVTGWCVMAYESGDFFGLSINKSALTMAATWFDQVSDPSGRTGYTKRGERGWRKPGEHQTRFPVEKGEALTAVALLCRFFMSQDPEEKPVMKAAADRILAKPPVWDEKTGAIDHYYWYYATYALFQMGGHHWTEWRRMLDTAVVENQRRDKAQKNLFGSWDPKCAWGEDGGRVYSTAMLVLTLEAHYRYSKLVR